MKNGHYKIRRQIFSAAISSILFMTQVITGSAAVADADRNISVVDYDHKMDSELKAKLEDLSDNDPISVWIFLKSVTEEKINQHILNETGMDPAVYEDSKKFNEEIRPLIVQQIEKSLGYEKAHTVVTIPSSSLNNLLNSGVKITSSNVNSIANVYNAENNTSELRSINEMNHTNSAGYMDNMGDTNKIVFEGNSELITLKSPVELAVEEECNRYLKAFRIVSKRENTAVTQKFLNDNFTSPNDYRVIYEGEYTTTLILEVKKSALLELIQDDRIENISLYKQVVAEPDMITGLSQVGVYCNGGTGYDIPNGGRPAYKGIGVNVGIIEIGRFDSSAPMLAGKNNLHFIENTQSDGSNISYNVDDHATLITSIIAGKDISYGGKTYEGIVPGATVYQTVAYHGESIATAIKHFAERDVHVINMSLGFGGGNTYSEIDKEVDKALKGTKMVFVKSAGNTSSNVTSPGKALNVITAGNAATKTSATVAASSPFLLSASSSYQEDSYLPNKPDISAPGTNISVPLSNRLYTGSGTSFAAPIVAGVASQMINANSLLKNSPTATKALLILSADGSKISSSDNSLEDSTILREKSGAGFLNAINAVTYAYDVPKYTIIDGMDFDTPQFYCTKGQKIRAVLVFDKKNESRIISASTMDNHDLYLYNAAGTVQASSTSARNNVEIIEYTIPSTGYYYLRALSLRTVDLFKYPNVTLTYKLF